MKRRDEMTDRELLIRIDERTENQGKRLDSHSTRIRALEVGVVSALAALVIAFKEVILKKLAGGQ